MGFLVMRFMILELPQVTDCHFVHNAVHNAASGMVSYSKVGCEMIKVGRYYILTKREVKMAGYWPSSF